MSLRYKYICCKGRLPQKLLSQQGTKLTFFSRRHLAPKFSKAVTKSKKLVAPINLIGAANLQSPVVA